MRCSHVIAILGSVAYYRAEIHKPGKQGSHRIRRTLSIYHKDDGEAEDAGYLVGGAAGAVVAVIKAHHALDDADIGNGVAAPTLGSVGYYRSVGYYGSVGYSAAVVGE